MYQVTCIWYYIAYIVLFIMQASLVFYWHLRCNENEMYFRMHIFDKHIVYVEFIDSHAAGTPSPSHKKQVEEQAPKPVGWMMCFLLMTLFLVCILNLLLHTYRALYLNS